MNNRLINNIFSNIPEVIPEEIFETIIQSGSVRIERIVSLNHNTPDGNWYDQDWDEWVIVLKGSAVIEFDNNDIVNLGVGDYCFIGSHQKHRVLATSFDEATIWLAVHIH